MVFAIRRPTPRPHPLNGTNFVTFFYPTFFLLQLNLTYMKRILHFQNITFKSSYNWFKIDIQQQLRPLTANYLAMFKVISSTIYTLYKAQTKCKTRFNSQGMILNGFQKNHFSE